MHYHIFWYRVVQWFTGLFSWKHDVKPVGSTREIAERLDWGRDYKADRKGGDRFFHPRKVQKHIDNKELLGDCEDHAGYWISCLLQSGLAKRAWLGAVFFLRGPGMEGHAVAIFEDFDGKFWWADYGMPNRFEPAGDGPGWAWAPDIARAFGARLCWRAEIYPVRAIKNDGLRFSFKGVDNAKLNIKLNAQP